LGTTEQDVEHLDPVRLARELNRCRQHGLDDLDLNLHKKPAVPEAEIAYLAGLARAYRAAIGAPATTREAAIRRLLVDGLEAYAERGDPRDSEFVRRFFFDESGAVPKKGPTELQKDLTQELHIGEKRLAELRTAAFIRFATFLIPFVAKLSHVIPAVEVREVIPTSAPQSPPPPQRLGCAHVALTGLVVLVIAGVVFARLLVGAPTLPNQATTVASAHATIITGSVECWPDTTKAVEGVYIVASNGGSGWADWHALPGHPNVALFSRTLPNGGSYVVHVGCGGTRHHWELKLDAVTPVMDSGYHFTCYDTTSDQNPYLGQCRP